MPLEVHPCTTSDFSSAVQCEKSAWSDDPFSALLFPGPFPPEAMEFRIQEMAAQLADDPTTRWLKVVDTARPGDEAREGIAFAKWHVYKDAVPGPAQSRAFGEGCNVEACEMVFGGLRRQREILIGGLKCVYLQILITDPAHQRRGAGGLLVQWGIDEAQRESLPVYVESSVKGHELYKKYGFKDLELHEIDLSRFGAPYSHRTWAMMCETKG